LDCPALMNTPDGGLHGAYVLRCAAKSNFKYESGKTKLLNLNLDLKNPQTMILSTAADDALEETVEGGEAASHTRSKLFQLSTSINLDSQYSVSFNLFSSVVSANSLRLDVLVLC
jgi:DNA mismatch repair protein MSH5